jgi:alpha-aminoadipic semialdehyde synthase
MYWDAAYPRLITADQLSELAKRSPLNGSKRGLMLRAVADISCDIEGSIGFLTHSTTFDQPYFEWDATKQQESPKIGAAEQGVLLLGVDILPTALPKEASKHFGDQLVPLLGSAGWGTRCSCSALPTTSPFSV